VVPPKFENSIRQLCNFPLSDTQLKAKYNHCKSEKASISYPYNVGFTAMDTQGKILFTMLLTNPFISQRMYQPFTSG